VILAKEYVFDGLFASSDNSCYVAVSPSLIPQLDDLFDFRLAHVFGSHLIPRIKRLSSSFGGVPHASVSMLNRLDATVHQRVRHFASQHHPLLARRD